MAMGLPLPPLPDPAWAYFLDVDGTLLEIADTPEKACFDEAVLDLIERVHRATGGAMALVSGRSIEDLDARIGKRYLSIAGQHGLERRDACGRLRVYADSFYARPEMRMALDELLGNHPALLLEDKGLTMALHYRQAPHLASQSLRIMTDIVARSNGKLTLQHGKCVFEIRPAGFDKGVAVAEYLKEPPFAARRPVFIGDDRTDEHGFDLVDRVGGVSIKVGHGKTCARYRLPDVAAVRHWLSQMLGELK